MFKKKIKGEFHPIRKVKEIIEAEIPNILAKKFFGQMIVGIIMIFIGISIIPFTWSLSYSALPIIIGIALIISGLLYKGSILIDGFTVIEGTIIERSKFLPGKEVADAYIIQTDSGTRVHAPNDKRKHPFPIGTDVRIYISKRSSPYCRDEYTIYYGDVLGYEPLVPAQTRNGQKNNEESKQSSVTEPGSEETL